MHFLSISSTSLPLLLLLIIFNLSREHQVESLPLLSQNHTRGITRGPITLEEAFLGELRAKEFGFEWLAGEASDNKDVGDQLFYEDSKNILLVTLPSIERRNSLNLTGAHAKSHGPPISLQPNITVLVSNSSLLASIDHQGYKISPSKRYLLLWNSRRKQFRHSSTARYFLYDIKLELITLLSTRGKAIEAAETNGFNEEDEDSMRFQVVEWYSKKANNRAPVDSLILIQNNDIYNLYDVSRLAISSGFESEVQHQEIQVAPTRLTFTGKNSELFNGVPDWLYEEEILGDTPAFQVSPQADHLAYISFNDSQVNIMPYTIYGDLIIPRVQQIRYPKTGQPNPRVSVHIVENLSSLSQGGAVNNIQVSLPDDLAQVQHYINRITWLTNDKLGLIWSNRNQNNSYIVICSKLAETGPWKCNKNLNIKSENGWLDISDDIMPLDNNYYLALMPKYEGPNVGEFKHIARVSLTSVNSFAYLTSGIREVIGFNGIDYKRSLVYYTSTVLDEPGQRQLFVAELESTTKPDVTSSNVSELSSSSVCVTCDHHPDGCLYNYARMSPSTNYYVFQCAGPDIPRTELRATRRRRHRNFHDNLVNDARQRKFLNDSTQVLDQASIDESASNSQSSLLWTLEDNKELRDKLENDKLLPVTVRTRVQIPNTNYSANVLLLMPPIRPGGSSQPGDQHKFQTMTSEQYAKLMAPSGQQFPMVVDVYGGPGSQKVDYRFNVNFGHYMASSKQIIYAMIDGRGSGNQGTKRLYELYHRLGTVEIQDQIDVTAQLARTLPFVDPARVAIWGWSYGGYAAAMALAQSKMRANQELQAIIKSLERSVNNHLNSTSTVPVNGALPRSVFKCAASVAPVTNWIYYDTAYTEKYMSSPWTNEKYDEFKPGDHLPTHEVSGSQAGWHDQFPTNKWTPLNQTVNFMQHRPRNTRAAQQLISDLIAKPAETNATLALHRAKFRTQSSLASSPSSSSNTSQNNDLNERYRNASLLDQIMHTDSKHFLLVHGTADDNVNFQQSIMLMKRLIKMNILFETRLYPDQDHGIANKADKLHLGSTLNDFLVECLNES